MPLADLNDDAVPPRELDPAPCGAPVEFAAASFQACADLRPASRASGFGATGMRHRHAEQPNVAIGKERRGALKRAKGVRRKKLAPTVATARPQVTAKPEKPAIQSGGRLMPRDRRRGHAGAEAGCFSGFSTETPC